MKTKIPVIHQTKSSAFLLLFILSIITLPLFGQGKMGVNHSKGIAFVNIMDEGSRFTNVISLDNQGWPDSDFTQIFDWRLVAEWVGPADDPQVFRYNHSGTYECSFLGSAIVTAPGTIIANQSYDLATNTTTFNVTVPTTNNGRIFWQMVFNDTKKNATSAINTGISKLKINRPGYSINTTQTFTTEYIDLCTSASFACYRYYSLNNVWKGAETFPAVSTWGNRKLPSDANQANMINVNGKVEGWSWEYIIELANILQKDIWINLNVSIDDNYVTSLATKLQAELNPNINIYIEYGNEVWNPNFNVCDFWIRDEAANLGITFNENYARNVVRISNLFKSVYGTAAINSKIRMVLGAQQGWMGRSTIHLNYIQNTFGNPNDFIWAIAPATYYSGPGATIEESLNNCHTSIMKQYDDVNDDPSLLRFMQLANDWSLPGVCVSYEGQEHANIGNTNNLAVDIGKHRDPRMATEQYANFQSFFDNGGTLACQFGIWVSYTRYGCWGLTDDPFNPDRNYKFKAARTLCNDTANAMTVPTFPSAPSCLVITAISNTEKKLDWIDNATSEDGYEIWTRDSSSSIWKYYSTVGPDVTTDTVIHTSGISYEFRVRSYNFSQWSPYNQPCSTTGIDNNSDPLKLELFPNPTNNEVNLYFNSTETSIAQITVLDMSFRNVLTLNADIKQGSNVVNINTASLSSGVYMVVLKQGPSTLSRKLIIEN